MIDNNSYTILIAEDDPFLVQSIHHILDDFKLSYKVVQTGKQVLEEYHNDYYDMVLMDIMLPDLDGFETAKEIRKHNMHTPIVAFTALEYSDIKSQLADCGINHYIQKPSNVYELRKLLKSYFSVAA